MNATLNTQANQMLDNLSAMTRPHATELRRVLAELRDGKPEGTYKKWCEAHTGEWIDTIQWTASDDSANPQNLWAPGPRRLSTDKATAARFDNSVSDYKGVRVISATQDAIYTESDWGDDAKMYRVLRVTDPANAGK